MNYAPVFTGSLKELALVTRNYTLRGEDGSYYSENRKDGLIVNVQNDEIAFKRTRSEPETCPAQLVNTLF